MIQIFGIAISKMYAHIPCDSSSKLTSEIGTVYHLSSIASLYLALASESAFHAAQQLIYSSDIWSYCSVKHLNKGPIEIMSIVSCGEVDLI